MKELVVGVLVIVLMLGITGFVINLGGIEYEDTVEITVEEGDTLWSIASDINPEGKYNMNEITYHIKEINNIDSSISAGDVIEVPVLKGGE